MDVSNKAAVVGGPAGGKKKSKLAPEEPGSRRTSHDGSVDVFFDAKGPAKDVPRNLVRFAVCKSSETIGKCAEAIRNNPVGAGRK